MKTLGKKLMAMGVAATVLLGMVGTVSAEVCANTPWGVVCQPVCQNVWIQTGPYAGQGYWTTVCS